VSINVAGFEVGDADFVTVAPLTTEVEVIVELTDPDASYVVEGGTDLLPGDNDLLIIVIYQMLFCLFIIALLMVCCCMLTSMDTTLTQFVMKLRALFQEWQFCRGILPR
jgi:hypothetical protein